MSRYCALKLALAATAVLATYAAAQSSFEVAAVKPAPERPPDIPRPILQNLPGGRFAVNGMTLRALIAVAYDVREFQISGGPGWMNAQLWDITAKAEGAFSGSNGAMSIDEMRPILRALMEERFQLKFRRETKEMPIYALVVAKNGPKLAAASPDAPPLPVLPGMAPPPPADGPRGPYIRLARARLDGRKVQLKAMIPMLPSVLGRPLVDQTGLDGEYDFTVTWTPDAGPLGPDAAAQADSNSPSIFTAFQEQLGLRLDSQKGPVELIVIDRVEKPSEN